jgi:Na+/proline symporter
MSDLSLVLFAVFVAASLPFLVSILFSLNPNLSSDSARGYFLANRELSVSGFIASTIGYSLQVSSIYLFFYWGILYGLYPVIMCITWALGYALLARLVRDGRLDGFLGLKRGDQLLHEPLDDRELKTRTIHGYVAERISQVVAAENQQPKKRPAVRATVKKRLAVRGAVLAVSLASVVGIAGTMMTEIDYSAVFFLQAIAVEATDSVIRYFTQISILLFTALYVLWGGFKAAVWTDRLQVPVAYVGLGVFTVGLSFYALRQKDGFAVVYLLLILLALYLALLVFRIRALAKAGDAWSRTIAGLTFGSLLFVTFVAICLQPWSATREGLNAFFRLLHPSFPSQFVLFGGLSLFVTNVIWQLIDISGLQRLQAIDKEEIQHSRSEIADVIKNTGIEAGLGWVLIIMCALVLKLIGIAGPNDLIKTLFGAGGWFVYLVPVFILTVVVFMLSTISGFISSVAYIAHYDIAPALGLYEPGPDTHTGDEIRLTRMVTLVCVALIYLGYTVLRATTHDDISTLLYAIWAFQLAITPSIVTALLRKERLSASAVIFSTISGLATAWYVATHPLQSLFGISIDSDAWAIMPPLAVVSLSSLVFILFMLPSSRSSVHTKVEA